ncbi:endopeptidase [Cryptococcus deuterogattii R265]|uniref:endopeptidase n=1 Tax=Cryptococcus deuterogattii (strain R265) TaxID=294750 RepID=UPI001936D1A2|nr:endopeptidase [Cryptococcus deuterogattii R265]
MLSFSPTFLFILLSLISHVVVAVPIATSVTQHHLKLRKLPVFRDDEHPVVAFERHYEAAIRRLYSYKRLPPPQRDYFVQLAKERRHMLESDTMLHKRTWTPPSLGKTRSIQSSKRAYWREGGNKPSGISESLPKIHKLAINGTGTAAAAASSTVTASGSNSNGFSQAAADAGNILTNSTSALVQGGLHYTIYSNDIGYLCEVQIGTPPQSFLMLMDTGSADTWVPSTECLPQNCGNHLSLGANVSSTFQKSNRTFEVTYGSGAVSGVIGVDTITVAGMTLDNHPIGVTLQESVQFADDKVPFDGLMGLAMNQLSHQDVPTIVDSLQSTGLIKNAILGIALGRFTDGENDGELVFGQADASKFDPSTTQTLPVTSSDGFWQVSMSAVTIDGQDAVVNRQAILDTGTTLMMAPNDDAIAFHELINGSASIGNGMFSIPCTIEQVVTMTFGNVAFQIDVRDLIFQPITTEFRGSCVSSVSAGTIKNGDTWLLGDSFLKNVYMTTNVNDKTVQLSARMDAPESSSHK